MTLARLFEDLGRSASHEAARAKALHLLVTGPPHQLQTACGRAIACWYPKSNTGLSGQSDEVLGLTLEKGQVFGCLTCERVRRA